LKVAVLGAGVIGVSTAYHLARAGAEVVLIERREGPALETSFANAGQVSPGYSTPWAAPGIPLKALRWLFQRHAPLAIRPDGTIAQCQLMPTRGVHVPEERPIPPNELLPRDGAVCDRFRADEDVSHPDIDAVTGTSAPTERETEFQHQKCE